MRGVTVMSNTKSVIGAVATAILILLLIWGATIDWMGDGFKMLFFGWKPDIWSIGITIALLSAGSNSLAHFIADRQNLPSTLAFVIAASGLQYVLFIGKAIVIAFSGLWKDIAPAFGKFFQYFVDQGWQCWAGVLAFAAICLFFFYFKPWKNMNF